MALKGSIGEYNSSYKYSQMMGKYGAEGFAPAIITCSITGGMHGKEANPNLPESVDEQVQQAYDAYNAGATMIHIHRRDPQNTAEMTKSWEDYLEVNARIREKCPDVIINNTSMGGQAWIPGLSQLTPRMDTSWKALPEVTSIDMFTCFYQIHRAARGPELPFPREAAYVEQIYTMTQGLLNDIIPELEKMGIKPEFECTSTNDLKLFNGLLKKFKPQAPYWFQLLVNGQGTLPTAEAINNFAALLPDEAVLGIIGIGAAQFPMVAMGLAMGHNVRVGLEDNVYYSKGKLATSNAQLVERAVRLANEIGRKVATPAEAREIMGLGAPRAYTK